MLVDGGKAEDLAIPVSSAINISDIKASFDNSACCRSHEGLQLSGDLTFSKSVLDSFFSFLHLRYEYRESDAKDP